MSQGAGCRTRFRSRKELVDVSEKSLSDRIGDLKDGDLQSSMDRRMLRSHYQILKRHIAEERNELVGFESRKLDSILQTAGDLHNLVRRPREQIADAEALLDITNAVLTSVKASRHGNGVTVAEFIAALAKRFGQPRGDEQQMDWGAIGLEACRVFSVAPGMCTMLGPMESEPKIRKVAATRRRAQDHPTEYVRPETIVDESRENKETDKNIKTMFNILRRCGENGVQMENLILNRHSFSQTVENLFCLSFLVKDGRVGIDVKDGKQIASHRYAPSSGERLGRTDQNVRNDRVVNTQYVFRLDFTDWRLMRDLVEDGKELMPHRESSGPSAAAAAAVAAAGATTPIRKNSRNRGHETALCFEEHAVSLADASGDEDGPPPLQRNRPSPLKRHRVSRRFP